MQVHDIKKPKNLKRKKRVGRGGSRGTYSGRGVKGQKSRAGARIRPEIWDYITSLPKMTGPTQKQGRPIGSQNSAPVVTVNVSDINKKAKSGDVVDVDYLVKNGMVRRSRGKNPQVKLLGKGELSKKITVSGLMVSASAKEKVETAGGEVK